MKQRIFSVILVCCLLLTGLSGCASQPSDVGDQVDETRVFVDSTGHEVVIPAKVERIAVSGPLTQVYVLPLCPEMLVGFAAAFSEDAARYLPEDILQLPELGQLYGGKAEMDLEALLAAAPDVVVDVGDGKDRLKQDMEDLTAQTGIPFVHIDATTATAADAYRKLGELTGKTEKAEELAQWCEGTYAMIEDLMAQVDAKNARRSVLYCLGDKGLNVMAEGSFHADTVNMLGNNLAKLTEIVSHGGGNEVDMEQIILWDPEVIIFSPESIYDTVADDPAWQQLTAVASGDYYRTPTGPYGWLSSPPAVQRYLGMVWLGAVLYPEDVSYDLREIVTEYYQLFYDCALSDEMYQELMLGALPNKMTRVTLQSERLRWT